jgi:hypothetical protein
MSRRSSGRNLSLACIALFALALIVSACGGPIDADVESRKSHLTANSYRAKLVIPAYLFTTSADWDRLFNDLGNDIYNDGKQHQLIVIVNGPNNGPPATMDYTLQSRILYLEEYYEAQVLGYVNSGTSYYFAQHGLPGTPHTEVELDNQIAEWMVNYYTAGIFFDAAERRQGHDDTDAALTTAMRLADYVTAYTNDWTNYPALMMFNWGVPYPEMRRYVDCVLTSTYPFYNGYPWDALMFVSQETSQSGFAYEDPQWSWIYNYRPTHFVSMLNSVNTAPVDLAAQISAAAGTMRQRNSSGFFFTERADYNALPGPPPGSTNAGLLWQLDRDYDYVAHNDYGGSDWDSPLYQYANCPYEYN